MNTLLWSLVRNIGSGKLNRDKIGYQIEKQFDAITHDDAQAYAEAIKDRTSHLKDPNRFVTPFYPSRLLSSMAKEMIALKGLNLNLLKMVHGEQEVVWHHPVRVGDRLKFTLAIERITETPAGDLLTLLAKGFHRNGLMIETRMGFLVRMKTKLEKSRSVETGAGELFRLSFQTDEGQQLLYADASGDDNFIHTSTFLARMAGLPRTIMQGVCIMAMTCTTLSEELIENDPSRLVSIRGRFAQFVLPGQRLEVVGYESNHPSSISFEVVNSVGKKVIKNGGFEFRAA